MLGAVLAGSTTGARAVPTPGTPGTPGAPVAGATGVGDDYWPLDGNGGIDVRHYDIDVAYDFAGRRLTGTTTVTMRLLDDLSSFHLDLVLAATGVTVDGVPAGFEAVGPHELRVTPAVPLSRGDTVEVEVAYAGEPGRLSYAGESQLARLRRRGRHHERAAHGAVVVPRQRPPERQGAVRHHGDGAGDAPGGLQRRSWSTGPSTVRSPRPTGARRTR